MIWQDGDIGDDDQDEDRPRETDTEGRVEKYIGVKVKASIQHYDPFFQVIF